MKDEVEKTVIHMSLLAWKNGDITMIELKKVLDKAQVEAVRAARIEAIKSYKKILKIEAKERLKEDGETK